MSEEKLILDRVYMPLLFLPFFYIAYKGGLCISDFTEGWGKDKILYIYIHSQKRNHMLNTTFQIIGISYWSQASLCNVIPWTTNLAFYFQVSLKTLWNHLLFLTSVGPPQHGEHFPLNLNVHFNPLISQYISLNYLL